MDIYIYYVYAYLREKDGTPYYIGKGKGNRAFVEHRNGKVPVPKDKSKIVFIFEELSEQDAFALECRLIKYHGRKDNNTGILQNLTDGGDGASGSVHSEETKQKIRNARIGTRRSIETRQILSSLRKGKSPGNKGKPSPKKGVSTKPHSEETKQKMSDKKKSKPWSDARRAAQIARTYC
jgi:hypothetical protein